VRDIVAERASCKFRRPARRPQHLEGAGTTIRMGLTVNFQNSRFFVPPPPGTRSRRKISHAEPRRRGGTFVFNFSGGTLLTSPLRGGPSAQRLGWGAAAQLNLRFRGVSLFCPRGQRGFDTRTETVGDRVATAYETGEAGRRGLLRYIRFQVFGGRGATPRKTQNRNLIRQFCP